MKQTYPVKDYIPLSDLKQLGTERNDQPKTNLGMPSQHIRAVAIRAVATGEKRCPKKGEWYLSGAIVEAYRAPNDLSTVFHIAKLVR